MEIHLDLMGGMAGDMFIAAITDALPEYEHHVVANIGRLFEICPVTAGFVPHQDSVLKGRQFQVRRVPPKTGADGSATSTPIGQPSHGHQSWRSIRTALELSTLPASVREHANGIFALLAQAEAVVHGVDIDSVDFHEVGAWDSIADIVGAATLIDGIQATSWTMSPAPLGSGRVHTAHGMLPVPAPATAQLLLGMATLDDGIPGERVTISFTGPDS